MVLTHPPVCPSQGLADPAGYGGPPGTRITGEATAAGRSVVSRGDDHEVLKVRGSSLQSEFMTLLLSSMQSANRGRMMTLTSVVSRGNEVLEVLEVVVQKTLVEDITSARFYATTMPGVWTWPRHRVVQRRPRGPQAGWVLKLVKGYEDAMNLDALRMRSGCTMLADVET